jgi:hypothetical protein
MRRKKLVDDLEDFRRCGVRRLVQQVNQTGGEEEKKWHGGKQNVEGNSAREKEDVVFAAIVPDAFRVVAEQPAEPGWEPALWH